MDGIKYTVVKGTHDLRVFLDGKHVGTIEQRFEEKAGTVYQYFPKGHTDGGEVFPTLLEVKRSLEMPDPYLPVYSRLDMIQDASKDPLVVATRKAYKASPAGQLDQLLEEERRWKYKETLASTKLRAVRDKITRFSKQLAHEATLAEVRGNVLERHAARVRKAKEGKLAARI
jgi:hypothetical protein